MRIIVLDSSLIVNFPKEDFDSKVVCDNFSERLSKSVAYINDPRIDEWTLYFVFCYTNSENIYIYMNGRSYLNEKYKEITIHIPIPSIEEASWGVMQEQFVYQDKIFTRPRIKNVDALTVNYSQFSNLTEYILDSMHRSIIYSLKKGVKINSVLVRLEEVRF
jgi:hypothetical protein